MKQGWIKRRWYDFRNGHGIYLIFALTFSNFVLIFYRLLIERVPFLDEIFTDLWLFMIIFVLIYVPVAVLIGHWHKKTQMKVETEVVTRQNPLIAKFFRIIIDIQTGKATEKEVNDVRELLKSIEEGTGMSK